MTEITHTYSKLRKDFSKTAEFQTNDAEQVADIAPDESLKAQHIRMDPYETEVQNVPQLTESTTNTERISLRHQGQVHEEGGWPLGIDPTEFEEKMKHCKKAERDETYVSTCKQLVERCMDKYLKQNNALDIYGSYFADQQAEQSAMGPPTAKTITVFKDPSATKRAAVSLSWLGDGKKLAVAYCHLRFQANVEGVSTASHIWDVTNPNEPTETLVPQSPLCCIEYYGKDPHLIAGGSYNGVVQYWDTRTPHRPVAKSNIEESHKDAIWNLKWLQSKSGEILSVSTDGQAFIWDARKPDKPTETSVMNKLEQESLVLHPKSNEGGARGILGGTCIDYDAQVGGPAKYMIGTEQGTILSCNRKAKSMTDKIMATFNGHHGPVYAVQRNPTHAKYFLSVGDWTARLWCEDFRGPCMFTTFYHRAHLTNGCWHPLRTGVFFTTRMDGCVDIWDLMDRQSTPVLSCQVSDYALHTIRCTPEGHHLAVGGVDGTTTLIELSPSLYTGSSTEKNHMQKIFENEYTRDKNLQSRQKEKNMKQKKMQQGKSQDKEQTNLNEDELKGDADKYMKDIQGDQDHETDDMAALEEKRQKMMNDIEDGMEIDDEAEN